MPLAIVDAYSEFHPDHERLMQFECDTGLDISLLPNFEVAIEVPEEVSVQGFLSGIATDEATGKPRPLMFKAQ